jgi:hypothetical protein
MTGAATTSAAVTATPAPDSAAAIEARGREIVLVTKASRSPASRTAAAPRPPSNGFHDTIMTAAEAKPQGQSAQAAPRQEGFQGPGSGAGQAAAVAQAGDSATFVGDLPHGYANAGKEQMARFALTVFEPGVGPGSRSEATDV